MTYACPEGERLRRAWYAQRAAGERPEWCELAHQDYFNHRHVCVHGCRDIMDNPIGNVPILVHMPEAAEVEA